MMKANSVRALYFSASLLLFANTARAINLPTRNVPGLIQAEDFDTGGEGIAYHDTTATNEGGAYRAEGPDVFLVDGYTELGNIHAGEWVNYTINVTRAGYYSVDLRVACALSGGEFDFTVDNGAATKRYRIPDTGAWNNFQLFRISNLQLSAGTHTIKVGFDSNGASGFTGNLESMNFVEPSEAPVDEPDLEVKVVPLLRTAYFQFRLDQIPNVPASLYSPEPTNDIPTMLEIPPVHRARLQWRVKSSDSNAPYKDAQDFVRVQGMQQWLGGRPDPRMVTMLFGLRENETYEYKVTFSGAGYPSNPTFGSFTTRTTQVPIGSAPTVVIAPSTIGNGTTAENLIRNTLGPGGGGLNIDRSAAGKVIEFRMEERSLLRTNIVKDESILRADTQTWQRVSGPFGWSGTEANWLTIRGEPGKNVVLDGSDPYYDVKDANRWEVYQFTNPDRSHPELDASASLKIYRTKLPFFSPNNPEVNVTDLTNPLSLRPEPLTIFYEESAGAIPTRLLRLTKSTETNGFEEMKQRILDDPHTVTFYADPDGRIYVHLPLGKDPNTVFMKIPVIRSSLDIEKAEYIKIKDLTLQYFRGRGTGYFKEMGGIHMMNVKNLQVENVTFKGLAYSFGARWGINEGPYRNNIVVKECTFIDGLSPVYDAVNRVWNGANWGALKGHPEENHAIHLRGNAVSILDSTFIGFNNGITSGEPQQGSVSDVDATAHPVAWEIDNNSFKGISDDAIEMEVCTVGIAATRNKIRESYKGVSMAPLPCGPQYHIRETFIGRGEFGSTSYKQTMFKFGNNTESYPLDLGYKFLANNTFINTFGTPNDGLHAKGMGFDATGLNFNLHVHNNYLIVDNFPISMSDPIGFCYPHIFNHNVYSIQDPTSSLTGLAGNRSRQFGIARACPQQGDHSVDVRDIDRFEDWQKGYARRDTNAAPFPGYVANPSDLSEYLHNFHDALRPWLHDPDSKAFPSANLGVVPPDLMDIAHENLRPKANSIAIDAGEPLANITYDVGPGWAEYNESQIHTTVGAFANSNIPSPPNPPSGIKIKLN